MPPDYWSDEQLQITIRGPHGVRCETVDRPFALLGSHPSCDLILDARLPRRCLCIAATDRGLGGVILSSASRLAGRFVRLVADRPLKLRSFEIEVRASGTVRQCEPQRDARDGDGLWVVTWTTQGRRFYLRLPHDRPIVVGRSEPSHVAIADQLLSAVHCCLYRRHDQLWAFDLGSSNGLWSGPQRVGCTQLTAGESVGVGRTRLRFLRLQDDRTWASKFAEQQAELEHQRSHLGQLQQALRQAEEQWNCRRETEETRLDAMAAELQARSQELDEQHEATRQRASWQETEQTRLDDQAAELQMRIATSEEEQSQWRNACALRDAAAAERELRVAAELDEQRLELSRHAAEAQTVVRSGIEVLLAFRQAAETRVRDQEAAEANAARLGARIDELCRQQEEAERLRSESARRVASLQSQLADAQSRLEAAAQAAEQWNQDRRNVELDLAEREQILQAAELESGKRELQLIAMRTQLRKEQQQLERLRANQRNGRSEQNVATALPGSNSTESIARRNGQTAVAATADAETYLASHEFGRILDRAIDESRVISPEELHESS